LFHQHVQQQKKGQRERTTHINNINNNGKERRNKNEKLIIYKNENIGTKHTNPQSTLKIKSSPLLEGVKFRLVGETRLETVTAFFFGLSG
jgi:hypothetical protein